MGRYLLLAAAVGMGLCLSSSALAGIITLDNQSLTSILGATPTEVGSQTVSVLNAGNIKSTVYSEVFTNGSGLYAYLYQVDNTGSAGNSSVEQFTVWPFSGADPAATVMGNLTTSPADLLPGGSAPLSTGYVDPTTSAGPTISFYFPQFLFSQIPPGSHSTVLYVESTQAPSTVTGNVIDGSVASGPVVGPVPEPATMALLTLGLGGMMIRRRRK
jgi:hypothetical protein